MSTVEQHREALAKANVVRTERAALRRGLRSGDVQVGDVLRDVPSHVARMRLYDLLCLVPGRGPRSARVLMRKERIGELATVGSLTDRQREALVSELAKSRRPMV
jgi:hypothetical protein